MHKGSAEFPETKQFIQERLEQKCLKEIKSVQKVIYFFYYKPRSKELAQITFFIVQCQVLKQKRF